MEGLHTREGTAGVLAVLIENLRHEVRHIDGLPLVTRKNRRRAARTVLWVYFTAARYPRQQAQMPDNPIVIVTEYRHAPPTKSYLRKRKIG